jgi:hypothetical protein
MPQLARDLAADGALDQAELRIFVHLDVAGQRAK